MRALSLLPPTLTGIASLETLREMWAAISGPTLSMTDAVDTEIRPSHADAIVVAFRSEEVVRSCVEALRADGYVDKIIVVNNSPGDETQAALTGIEDVMYADSPGNVGFGRAVNSGRRWVQQPFVSLVNPDAHQSPGTVRLLVEWLQRHPRAGVVGPRLVGPDGRVIRTSKREMSLGRMAFEALGWPEPLQVSRPAHQHRVPHRTEYVTGSFVVCRVTALDQVDWFDPSIFLFGEDQDLCRRLRDASWDIWYAPLGKVLHLSGHSWRQLPDRGRSLFRSARRRALSDSGRPVQAMLYSMLSRLSDVVRGGGRG